MQADIASKIRVKVGRYELDVRRSIEPQLSKHMIFIHGIGMSGNYYLPFAKECAKEFNVHIIDMPGYAATPKPAKPLSLVEMAEVAADYISSSHIDQAIIVGHSMGCQIVAHLAAQWHELCTKLLLIGPTVNHRERNLLLQSIRLMQDSFLEPLGANIVVTKDYLRMGMIRYFKTSRFMIEDHIEKQLMHINQDVLLVRGENDNISPLEWLKYLSAQTVHSQVYEIPNAPHIVQYVKPKELFQVCHDFLDA